MLFILCCNSVNCENNQFELHFGRTNRTTIATFNGNHIRLNDKISVVRNIKTIRIHPGWKGDEGSNFIENGNDIALITLDQRVPFADEIIPACLPEENNLYLFQPRATVKASGFGYNTSSGPEYQRTPHKLQVTSLTLRDHSDCSNRLQKKLANDFLCGLGSTPFPGCSIGLAQDTCNGDSGGPMVAREPGSGQWIVGGITSFGTKQCGIAGFGIPAFFTNVYKHKQWILRGINQDGDHDTFVPTVSTTKRATTRTTTTTKSPQTNRNELKVYLYFN